MSNTLGHNIRISIFGESHQRYIGFTIDGLPAGMVIDEQLLNRQLDKRAARGYSTARQEEDRPLIISGYFEGHTTGAPLTMLFENKDVDSSKYDINVLRPSQADFTANVKYDGMQDYRGGGHFSGRLTVCLTAAGALCMQILQEKGIEIASIITRAADWHGRGFSDENMKEEILALNNKRYPVLEGEEELLAYIQKVQNEKDSIGGSVQTAVINLPAGIGEPFFDSLESGISHALFSIGGVKGVSFGRGYEYASCRGSQVNDEWRYDNGRFHTVTNNDGGINGGISNSMPVIINTVFKPTASIGLPQKTVNYQTGEEIDLQISGRHDPAIFLRGAAVIDSLTAFVLLDYLVGTYGKQWMCK